MKSAYGRTIPPPDVNLTSVEAGTPMGELMRRYWQPVCTSDELTDLPRKVKILCEELVVFRDKRGRVGALDPHCCHRGTSLEWGRIEEEGIRCCYHGWLYAVDGHCVDMPCEAAGACERRDIWQPAYPTMEFGGLVFLYMGPPGTEPELPMLDIMDTRHRDDVVLRGMRLWDDHALGYVRDCNWLQHYKNALDPYHLFVLHEMISGDQFNSALTKGGQAKIWFEPTPLGAQYKLLRELPNGMVYERQTEAVVPNIVLVANVHLSIDAPIWRERATEVTWCVPVDNETVCGLSIVAWPKDQNGAPLEGWRPGTYTHSPLRPGQHRREYEERQRKPDDMEAQEGQRRIAVHAVENLGRGDKGVLLLRRELKRAIADMEAGRDPKNVMRDPATNQALPTRSWNSILTREQLDDYRSAFDEALAEVHG